MKDCRRDPYASGDAQGGVRFPALVVSENVAKLIAILATCNERASYRQAALTR